MVEERYRELARLSDEMTRCGRCGFCQEVCPVYHVSAEECGVARGRNMFARELVSGSIELSNRNKAFFSECLLCRACVDVCFSAVRTDEIVLAGRKCQRRALGMSPIHRYIFQRLLPDHKRLGKLVRSLRTTQRVVPAVVFPSLRIFGWLGLSLERAERIAGEIPQEFLRERLARKAPRRAGTRRAVYFIGCGVNFMFPDAGEATIEVLEGLGYEVAVVEHGCCGLPAHSHGDIESARRLALDNLEAFAGSPENIIVTDCSSCASYLKEYPTLFEADNPSDEELRRQSQRFAGRVRDLTEILAGPELGRMLRQRGGGRPTEMRAVTFHEPCHLGRYQGLGAKARRTLAGLPGIEYVEMNEAAWCCGGAGAFALEHPDLSMRILQRKTRNVELSGADEAVTTCPSCMMQIRAGVSEAGLGIRVRHLSEIARDALSDRRGDPDESMGN